MHFFQKNNGILHLRKSSIYRRKLYNLCSYKAKSKIDITKQQRKLDIM